MLLQYYRFLVSYLSWGGKTKNVNHWVSFVGKLASIWLSVWAKMELTLGCSGL